MFERIPRQDGKVVIVALVREKVQPMHVCHVRLVSFIIIHVKELTMIGIFGMAPWIFVDIVKIL